MGWLTKTTILEIIKNNIYGCNVIMQMDTYNSNVSRFGVLVSPDLDYEIASNVN